MYTQQIKLDYICLSFLSSFISKNDDEILEIAFQIVRNSKNTYLPKLGSTFHCSWLGLGLKSNHGVIGGQ